MEEETKIPIYRIDDDHETRSNIFPRWTDDMLEVDENITRIIDQRSTVEDVILNCLCKEKQKVREAHYKGLFNIPPSINRFTALYGIWYPNISESRLNVENPFIIKQKDLDEQFEHNKIFQYKGTWKEQNDKCKTSYKNVEHPKHYTSHPSKIECITIIQYYNFCIGNAMKYLWRAGIKKEEGLTPVEKEIEDCKKAIWYINKHIESLK